MRASTLCLVHNPWTLTIILFYGRRLCYLVEKLMLVLFGKDN